MAERREHRRSSNPASNARPARPARPSPSGGPRASSPRGADRGPDAPGEGVRFNVGFGGDRDGPSGAASGGVEGLLGGLSGLLKTLSDLAEKGQSLRREVGGADAQGRDVRFHYGVSVRTMNDGRDVRVEPFGNLRPDRARGESVVQEVREPLTDVFEEDDAVLVVLEMPGVREGDVKTELAGDVLTVSAQRGSKRYRKEVLLPGERDYGRREPAVTFNNGVVEIRLSK